MAKPMKMPMKGMPMPMGKRSPPPPFPVPHPASGAPMAAPPMQAKGKPPMAAPPMQAKGKPPMAAPPMMQKPPGFAGGSPDVPAPGQTITSGSWEGPTTPPPPPSPLGGQNQNLRQQLGMGVKRYADGTPNVPAPGQTITNGSWTGPTPPAPPTPSPLSGPGQNLRQQLGLGVKRFAEGTSDVGAPNVGAEGGMPSPGYDAQSASYNNLDQHFVAHLRAALGLAPKEQGFAGGTSNVGFDLSGAPGVTNPTTPGVLDQIVGGGQPGGTVPDNPNDFTTRAHAQQMPNPAEGAAGPMPQGQPGGSVPGRVALGGGFQQAASQDPMFGSLLQALTSVPASRTTSGKSITDPDLVQSVATATGAHPDHVDAMLNPHEYTRDQFSQAVANMPWGQAKALWAMQHYLSPTQKAGAEYFQGLDQAVANDAKTAAAGGTAAQLKAYSDKLAADLAAQQGARKKAAEGQLSYTPDTQ